jgi:hypothetical protein
VSFDEEQIRRWRENKAEFEQFRREIEHEQHLSFSALFVGSPMQVEVFRVVGYLISL